MRPLGGTARLGRSRPPGERPTQAARFRPWVGRTLRVGREAALSERSYRTKTGRRGGCRCTCWARRDRVQYSIFNTQYPMIKSRGVGQGGDLADRRWDCAGQGKPLRQRRGLQRGATSTPWPTGGPPRQRRGLQGGGSGSRRAVDGPRDPGAFIWRLALTATGGRCGRRAAAWFPHPWGR